MVFDVSDMIFVINKNNYGVQTFQFTSLHQPLSKNDDLVARLKVSRRRPVKANSPSSFLARNNICLPKGSIRQVGDIYILKGHQARRLKEDFINRD